MRVGIPTNADLLLTGSCWFLRLNVFLEAMNLFWFQFAWHLSDWLDDGWLSSSQSVDVRATWTVYVAARRRLIDIRITTLVWPYIYSCRQRRGVSVRILAIKRKHPLPTEGRSDAVPDSTPHLQSGETDGAVEVLFSTPSTFPSTQLRHQPNNNIAGRPHRETHTHTLTGLCVDQQRKRKGSAQSRTVKKYPGLIRLPSWETRIK